MEMLSSDAIFEIAMRIEEPVDLINFYSVNKRILNLFNEYKLWKKHAKKFLNIDIPNSRKKCVEYAAKNREINDFLLNQYDDLKKLKNPVDSLLKLIEDTTSELGRETIRVQDILLYERDYVDWKLLEVMDKNRDFIRELPEKINLILTENTNEVDKKYMLYQVLLDISDKFAEVSDMI